MANCQERRVMLTKAQLNKLKFSSKNRIRTILRLNKKCFCEGHANNIKPNKTQICKTIQPGGSFGSYLTKESINKYCYFFN